ASYLDELERLEALRTKGVLTAEEFETQKKAALASSKPAAAMTVDELAGQFRTLRDLYNTSAINNVERDQKKQQLIDRPDLKKDLETVQGLYNESVITNVEHTAIKKKLLELP